MMIKMVSILVSCLLLSCCYKPAPVPPPPVSEIDSTQRYLTSCKVSSTILKGEMNYSIYLPENYWKDTLRSYPVVYLLHGYGDDHTSWNGEYLRVAEIINSMEESGKISPMIYVMPQGFNTYYVNTYNGSYKYMSYFTDELLPHIDSNYRTIPDRAHRATIGYSMGGYGAFILPFKNPNLFSVAAPLSMSWRTDLQYMTEPLEGWNWQWGRIFGGEDSYGKNRLTPYYKSHNPYYFLNSESVEEYRDLSLYIDCGDDEEQLLIANDSLHVHLMSIGLKHHYRVRNGAHTSSYWRVACREALQLIEAKFHSMEYDPILISTIDPSESKPSQIKVKGIEGDIYYPKDFDSSKGYSTLVFAYSGLSDLEYKKSIALLEKVMSVKSCVMLAIDESKVKSQNDGIDQLFKEAEKGYKPSSVRLGVGINKGGELLYNYSVGEGSLISSLFMVDATLPDKIAHPSQKVFYYYSASQTSPYYRGHHLLYTYCKHGGVKYEYRVSNSDILYQLESMIDEIKPRVLVK